MNWYFSPGVFHILNLKFSKTPAEDLKGQSRRPKHRKQDNIKIDLKEERRDDVKLFRCFRIGSVPRSLE
jgi:hypothetical protein